MYQILHHNHAKLTPLVVGPDGVDDDLTDGIVDALGRATSTRTKMHRLLTRTLNCLARKSADGRLDMFEDTQAAIRRFRSHLTDDLGCVVRPASGLRDGSFDVECSTTSATTVSLIIARTRRIYQGILGDHVQNPLAVDGWHLAAADRILTRLGRNQRDARDGRIYRSETGNRFRVVDRPWSPPPLAEIRGTTQRLIDGARRRNWPPVPMALLLGLRDDAPRSGDLLATNAKDWWNGSKFGRVVRAPVKGSDGKRVRDVVLSAETRDQIVVALANRKLRDPSFPDLEDLMAMAAERNVAGLADVPLFPGQGRQPMTHSGFHKTYFRPLVIAEDVTIEGPEGGRFARPHDIRHETIGELVDEILCAEPAGPVRDSALQSLNDRLGWRSYMIPHYAAPQLKDAAIRERILSMDGRKARPTSSAVQWRAPDVGGERSIAHAWPD